MPPIDPPFSRDEYAARLSKTRAAMQAKGIDTLIITDPSNMAWQTGYDGWSFYVHQAVLVGPEGAPLWWGRGIDENGALRTVYMQPERIRSYSDDFVQSTERHPMQNLCELIAEMGWDRGTIGVEMDNYYFSAAAFGNLQAGLPAARFADATALVNWQRAVKSEREIEFMRRAARIGERMHRQVLERMHPGLRKNDLIAEIYHAAIVGTESFGGDYPAIVPLAPTGADASAAHLTWDDRPLETGAATFFELSGCYRRYHAPICRTVFLGQPPAEMRNAESALIDGLDAGLDMARAGNRACDVANALYAALRQAGIEKAGRCGYPVGLSYPPDWGERTISFRASDETVLQPGMTFHFMPGIWMQDWGLEITESILIRDSGPAECLCDLPRKLFVKP